MKKLIIIILIIKCPVLAQDFKLTCTEANTSYDKNFNPSFTKIINFKDQTLFNYSGGYFDDVILFSRTEIILNNQIFNTRSTFNIITNKWTVYKGQFVKLYKCSKEKRRF